MKETQYIVAQARGEWTIRCGGRVFDRFEDKDDAILTALIQAQNARRQGRVSRVLLEELGHSVEPGSPSDAAPDAPVDVGDTFLTRWAAGQAMVLDSLAMLLGRPVGRDDVEPLTWALAEIGRERSAGQYLRDVALHQALTRAIAAWFEGGYDLLLTPTMAERPAPIGTWDDDGPDPMAAFERAYPAGAFTALFNVTGQPAISLPLHWSDDGLPVGVQLVAPYGREDLLIAVAAQLERAQPWTDKRPQVFAGAAA